MKDSARYAKIVAWSDEDQKYIGYAPGLIFGDGACCHGEDELAVFAELCEIVEEVVSIHLEDGTPLPPPTAGFDYFDILKAAADTQASERAPA